MKKGEKTIDGRHVNVTCYYKQSRLESRVVCRIPARDVVGKNDSEVDLISFRVDCDALDYQLITFGVYTPTVHRARVSRTSSRVQRNLRTMAKGNVSMNNNVLLYTIYVHI